MVTVIVSIVRQLQSVGAVGRSSRSEQSVGAVGRYSRSVQSVGAVRGGRSVHSEDSLICTEVNYTQIRQDLMNAPNGTI